MHSFILQALVLSELIAEAQGQLIDDSFLVKDHLEMEVLYGAVLAHQIDNLSLLRFVHIYIYRYKVTNCSLILTLGVEELYRLEVYLIFIDPDQRGVLLGDTRSFSLGQASLQDS